MAKLSRYFTPVLNSDDKERILHCLNLKKLLFRLKEEKLGQILLIQAWSECGALTEASEQFNQQLSSQPRSTAADQMAEIHISHSNFARELNSVSAIPGVFESIVPYPYSLLFMESKPAFSVHYHPLEFSQSLESLRSVVRQVEDRLSDFELGVVWITGIHDSFPLLCHFVRKKLIRVGSSPALWELCQRFESGGINPSELRQFFGTNTGFFQIKMNHSGELGSAPRNPLECFRTAIQATLSVSPSRVSNELLGNQESSPFLEFEL